MVKYTISSDDLTDEMDVKRATMANSAFRCLYDIGEMLRDHMKSNIDDSTYETLEDVMKEYIDILDSQSINLDYYYN